ncbi:hypothetical protein [Streptomyces avermitilis]|nr:hypothetical protein [Streptomyces avermitilis]
MPVEFLTGNQAEAYGSSPRSRRDLSWNGSSSWTTSTGIGELVSGGGQGGPAWSPVPGAPSRPGGSGGLRPDMPAAPGDPDAYDDIVPGGTAPAELLPALLSTLYTACLLDIGLSALVITGQAAVRLTRSRPPVRQQLAWMMCVLAVFLAALFFAGPLVHGSLGILVPIAVAVGALRYRMLGIETVMRRGLVYGLLTAVVVTVYLLVTGAVGAVWDRSALPGVLAAAVVAVGLSPARERLQQTVDWWVYGARRDPLRALTRLGSWMADAGEHDLLPAALDAVMQAVRAPGHPWVPGNGRRCVAEPATTVVSR